MSLIVDEKGRLLQPDASDRLRADLNDHVRKYFTPQIVEQMMGYNPLLKKLLEKRIVIAQR